MAEAHQLIDFFLNPEVAARIALENHLATPNRVARARLPKEHTDNPGLYPPSETMNRLRFLDDIGETLSTVNRMWSELKSS
jgi:spermidine/putrescine-binding protein